MSTTIHAGENGTDSDRHIDHDRYVRAICEPLTVTPFAPKMKTVEHEDTAHDVDLVAGACDCADARYRPETYCKHSPKAAIVAIYIDGTTTPFVARVARYIDKHPCPAGNHGLCDGPTGPRLPCPACVRATGVDVWIVYQQTAGRTGVRR